MAPALGTVLGEVVLRWSVLTPAAVLELPVVLLVRALTPVAVFCEPVVLWNSALGVGLKTRGMQ